MRATLEFRDMLDLYGLLQAASHIPAVTRNAALVAARREYAAKITDAPYRDVVRSLPDFTDNQEAPVAEARDPTPRPPAAPTATRRPDRPIPPPPAKLQAKRPKGLVPAGG